MRSRLTLIGFATLLISSGTIVLAPNLSGLAQTEISQSRTAATDEASRLLQQGGQEFRRGQYLVAGALIQQALNLHRQAKNRTGEAQALTQLSEVYYWFGQKQEAIATAETALTLYRELKDRKGEGEALDRLGEAYSSLGDYRGDYKKSLEVLQQALVVRREVADRLGEGRTLVRIGAISYKDGQTAKSLEALQQGLVLLQAEDVRKVFPQESRFDESLTLGWIGWVVFNHDSRTRGFSILETALKLSQGMKNGAETNALMFIGHAHLRQKEYLKALTFYQQALLILQSTGRRVGEADTQSAIADAYANLEEHAKAIEFYQKAFSIYQELKSSNAVNPAAEGHILNGIGIVYNNSEQYPQALDYYQRALVVYREAKSRSSEGVTLNNIGRLYKRWKKLPEALAYYRQALAIRREIQDRSGEGETLNDVGVVYHDLNQNSAALEYYQQALILCRETKNRTNEGATLNNIGRLYEQMGKPRQALDYHQQALTIFKGIGERSQEGETLNHIGSVHRDRGQNLEALKYHQQALAVHRAINNRSGEGSALNNMGRVYTDLGQYSEALKYHQQALAVHQAVNNRSGEGSALNNMGLVHNKLGQYAEALKYHQQALTIHRTTKNRSGEGTALNNMGLVYSDLGQRSKALQFLQQALAINREIKDRSGEITSLNNLATVYTQLKQYAKALTYYQQVVALRAEIKSRKNEGLALNNLGLAYANLGQRQKALEYYQQALVINREVNDRAGEGTSLNNMGQEYSELGDYPKALEFLQQAVAIKRAIGDRHREATALSNIGYLLKKQNQLEVAIVFLKQSVNTRETIRQDIRTLPREFQESYTESVADTYRTLAELLIKQGRLPEAQAVLELLKLRELREFTRDAGINSPGINLAKIEETALNQILQRFTTVASFSQQITNCEQKKCSELKNLQQQRDRLNQTINQELQQQRAILAQHFATQPATLAPEKLNAEARDIVNAQPGTVLIYPLVFKDKIQFLLAFQAGKGAVTFRTVEATTVNAATLNKTIQTFRNQLRSPGDLNALQATSQQLYTWLIKPLEPELKNAKHLVFAPDSTIRYIPLAALFNGKQYLIQRYSISTITAASQTDTDQTFASLPINDSFILAMGASVFPNLPSLDNVPAELDVIVKQQGKDNQGIFPGSEKLNTDFSYETLKDQLRGHRILHIATHGAFKPGRPEDSYLVPGRGDNLTTALINELGNYGLRDVHLVVLSACETGLGDRASDGMEIPGISYFFLNNKVKSVLASLWSVNDASTALSMQQFYKHLASGKTKAEALSAVQRDFLEGKLTAKDAPDRGASALPNRAGARRHIPGQPPINSLAHPYYWAPFILIGNSQ